MKIILPTEIKNSISTIGNKTVKNNAIKIYAALISKQPLMNKHGYFPVPSTYLEKINSRYPRIINKFIEDGILSIYKREKQVSLFETKQTKYYNTSLGICMKYKFLIDITKGEQIEVELKTDRYQRWYKILENSLIQLGYEVKIKRDSFGRRVHHPAIMDYKTELKNKNYALIDATTSQPKLLFNLMKERNCIDEKYYSIFESGKDFYNYLVRELNLENRDEAKDLFGHWVFGNGYVPKFEIHRLFPMASKFIRSLKARNYKDSSSFLQRMEAKIWIDDLLQNVPTDFALPVHDCLIVRVTEVEDIYKWCAVKYPQIDFKIEYL